MLPEIQIGDWLIWKDMGAYSIALATTFNGFPIPIVIPIIRKSQWLVWRSEIYSLIILLFIRTMIPTAFNSIIV